MLRSAPKERTVSPLFVALLPKTTECCCRTEAPPYQVLSKVKTPLPSSFLCCQRPRTAAAALKLHHTRFFQRKELLIAREKQKEEEVETLKRSMQGGMAQAMKEQAQLREEMAYQYKLGNFEAAAAIQRRLDPDVAM